jgi:hypothetical protein
LLRRLVVPRSVFCSGNRSSTLPPAASKTQGRAYNPSALPSPRKRDLNASAIDCAAALPQPPPVTKKAIFYAV